MGLDNWAAKGMIQYVFKAILSDPIHTRFVGFVALTIFDVLLP